MKRKIAGAFAFGLCWGALSMWSNIETTPAAQLVRAALNCALGFAFGRAWTYRQCTRELRLLELQLTLHKESESDLQALIESRLLDAARHEHEH